MIYENDHHMLCFSSLIVKNIYLDCCQYLLRSIIIPASQVMGRTGMSWCKYLLSKNTIIQLHHHHHHILILIAVYFSEDHCFLHHLLHLPRRILHYVSLRLPCGERHLSFRSYIQKCKSTFLVSFQFSLLFGQLWVSSQKILSTPFSLPLTPCYYPRSISENSLFLSF